MYYAYSIGTFEQDKLAKKQAPTERMTIQWYYSLKLFC